MFCTFGIDQTHVDAEGVTLGSPLLSPRPHQLALWVPEEEAAESSLAEAQPPENWRLRDFLRLWFAPNHLESRELASGNDYAAAVDWWEAVTDNPPLPAVTQHVATAARLALRAAVSPRTGKPIATAYQRKIVTHWRVLFAHAGPRFGRKGAYAGLLAEAPWFDMPVSRKSAKGTWDYSQARAIAAACARMCRPAVSAPGAWWRLAIATLYYFGLRDGQALGLRLGHVQQRADGWRLAVDEVEKTGKTLIRRCPDQWVEAYLALHGFEPKRDPDALILPWPLASRGRVRQLASSTRQTAFIRLHGSPAMTARARKLFTPQRTLQDLAGLTLENQWEPHAWRRLHVRLRTESGAAEAIAAGSGAAQHTDSAVTRNHYYDGDEGTPLVIEARFPLF